MFRVVLSTILCGIFLYQCYKGFKRWQANELGVTLTEDGSFDDDFHLFPAITVLIGGFGNGGKSLTDYDDIMKKEDVINSAFLSLGKEHINLLEENRMEEALFVSGDATEFSKMMTVGPNVPFPSSKFRAASISMEMNLGDHFCLIMIHDQKQFFYSIGELFGMKVMTPYIESRNNPSYTHNAQYDITRSRIYKLPTNNYPCDTGNRQFLQECIRNYWERKMDCKIPKNQFNQTNICQSDTLLDMLRASVLWNQKNLTDITGCLPNCMYHEYHYEESKIPAQNIQGSPTNGSRILTILLTFMQQSTQVTKEYEMYQWKDFLSQIGGYLGLLLGGSVLSVFDDVMVLAPKFRALFSNKIL